MNEILEDIFVLFMEFLAVAYLISVPVMFILFIVDGVSAKKNGRKRKRAVTIWFILTNGSFWLIAIFLIIALSLGMVGM